MVRARPALGLALLGTDGAAVVTISRQSGSRARDRGDLRTVAVRSGASAGGQPTARLAALLADQTARQADRDAAGAPYEAHPALRAMRAQAEPASPSAASILGGPGAAIVSFVVGEARTCVFAIANDAAADQWKVEKAAAIVVKSADLSQQIRRFREAIGRKEDAAIDLGRELHTLLVEPVAPTLAKKSRLVVVPDAFLRSLPFESLPAQRTLCGGCVHRTPSLTALVAMATRARAPRPPTWCSASRCSAAAGNAAPALAAAGDAMPPADRNQRAPGFSRREPNLSATRPACHNRAGGDGLDRPLAAFVLQRRRSTVAGVRADRGRTPVGTDRGGVADVVEPSGGRRGGSRVGAGRPRARATR
jgi:hypothetical protein